MALAGAGLLALSNPAQARIIQTGCDTLATDPPTVRFTFAAFNDCGVGIQAIQFIMDAGCQHGNDSCCVLACAAPENWYCIGDPTHGAAWGALNQGCVLQGQRVDGFSFITQVHACCFDLYCNECGAPGDPYCDEHLCFSLNQAVPARGTSWGRLKAIYR
jgi:hypothetical protein